jgi:hypothetical protein
MGAIQWAARLKTREKIDVDSHLYGMTWEQKRSLALFLDQIDLIAAARGHAFERSAAEPDWVCVVATCRASIFRRDELGRSQMTESIPMIIAW